jgi:hypothetical protein
MLRRSGLYCIWGLFVLTAGCGAGQTAKRLEDGSWRTQCVDHVDRCVREAERICGKRGYRVLGGHKETKLYGGETGYQTGADLHSLEFRCGDEAEPERAAEPTKPAAIIKKKTSTTKAVCTPGATQRCVGPAACEGGQSCNAEGTGFLPCDCGEPAAPAAAEPHPDPDAHEPPTSQPSARSRSRSAR